MESRCLRPLFSPLRDGGQFRAAGLKTRCDVDRYIPFVHRLIISPMLMTKAPSMGSAVIPAGHRRFERRASRTKGYTAHAAPQCYRTEMFASCKTRVVVTHTHRPAPEPASIPACCQRQPSSDSRSPYVVHSLDPCFFEAGLPQLQLYCPMALSQ